jgi:hypothetical protein
LLVIFEIAIANGLSFSTQKEERIEGITSRSKQLILPSFSLLTTSFIHPVRAALAALRQKATQSTLSSSSVDEPTPEEISQPQPQPRLLTNPSNPSSSRLPSTASARGRGMSNGIAKGSSSTSRGRGTTVSSSLPKPSTTSTSTRTAKRVPLSSPTSPLRPNTSSLSKPSVSRQTNLADDENTFASFGGGKSNGGAMMFSLDKDYSEQDFADSLLPKIENVVEKARVTG